jgi:acyl-coenzyme A thioesterase PaaI-like protein
MPESLKTKVRRWAFNFFPAYRGTGGRLTYISDDYMEIHVRLPLSWRTRNYVGTIFGGSMYGAVDPVYMIMLIKLLGRDYVVWDKAATISFRRPGRTTLRARFVVTPTEVAEIKAELTGRKSVDRIYTVELVDDAGKVHAKVEKTIYIARRERAEAGRAAGVSVGSR